jgi:hypothetical protein
MNSPAARSPRGAAPARILLVAWCAPPKQAAHQVERFLRLEMVRMTKRSHGVCGGASGEQRSMKAKGLKRLGENAKGYLLHVG